MTEGGDQCYVEIEYWDDANEQAVLHVKVPSISDSADTVLYLYFDSTQADNTTYVGDTGDAAAQNVWDSDFVGVHHLSETATGTQQDSTGNADASTSNLEAGDLVRADSGIRGLGFDGTDEMAATADVAAQSLTSNFFVECYADPQDNSALIEVWNKFDSENSKGWGLQARYDSSGEYEVGFKKANSDYHSYRSGTLLWADGAIPHLFSMYYPGDGSKPTFYVDGVDQTSDFSVRVSGGVGGINGLTDSGQGLKWAYGNVFHGTTVYSPVTVYETRLSKTERSAAWTKATYYTLTDALITFTAPWLDGWGSNRLKLTIDSSKIDSDLTDFPVAISLDSSCGLGSFDASDVFTELADADRKKIAITGADGVTEQYVEIELWDVTSGAAVLHTKCPSVLAAADTIIYLYFDADHAENTSYVGDTGDAVAQNVWDASFVGVWHMAQDVSAGNALGSHSAGDELPPTGLMPLVDAIPGKGLDLDGTNDQLYASALDYDGYGTDAISIEAVIDPDTLRTSGFNFIAGTWKDENYLGTSIDIQNKNLRSFIYIDSTAYITAGTEISTGAPVYTAVGWESGEAVKLYENEDITTGSVATGVLSRNGAAFEVGGLDNGGYTGRRFDGRISEIRYSNAKRSDAWLKATYHTLFDTLITLVDDSLLEAGADINVAVGAPSMSWSALAAAAGIGIDVNTPSMAWSVLAATFGIGFDVGTPSFSWQALSVAIAINLHAIGIMSRPNVSGKGPGATVTAKQPGATVTGKAPGATVTARGE